MKIDILSKGEYPSNILSNFYNNPFTFDGVVCQSMEGFLQSLKFKRLPKQINTCSYYGKTAKLKGKYKFLWKITGNVYWKGKKIKRQSKEFDTLIKKAYLELYNQNKLFQTALNSTKGYEITHSIGKRNKRKTILTEKEFIDILNELRDKNTLSLD